MEIGGEIEKNKDNNELGTPLQKLDSYWTEVEHMPVPDSIPSISLDEFPEEHRIEMFHLARDAWASLYEPDVVIKELQEGEPGPHQRSYLKNLRKHGLILRAGFLTLDGRHLAPENHWLFLRLLGELNDGYNTPQRAESAARLADFVKERYMTLDGLEFFPASDESFAGNYKRDLERVTEINSSPTLSAKDFHSMRKLLRNTMNMFRLSGTLTSDPQMRKRARYMQDLNETLGHKQDQLVEQDLQGVVNYQDATVIVPHEVRARINGFIRANPTDS